MSFTQRAMKQPVPCYFPSFVAPAIEKRRLESLRATLSNHEAGQLVSAACERSLGGLLQLAWALVLHNYTGSSEVCFGYQLNSEPGNKKSSTFPSMSAASFSFSNEDRLGDVMHTFQLHSDSFSDDQTTCPFNTILLQREGIPETEQLENSISPQPKNCRVRIRADVLANDVKLYLESWSNDLSSDQLYRVSRAFSRAVSYVLARSGETVGQLSLFTEKDWEIISRWNVSLPEVRDRCIHDIIRDQVKRWPSKEAVCSWDGILTYGELDSLSTSLAHYLQSRGVKPEVCVPLFFDKSKWYIVAMLGVLKSGGAFVPLDPSHPPRRLQSLLNIVRPKIVLCSSTHIEKLQLVTHVPVIGVNDSLISECVQKTSLSLKAQPGNAAYVIFTSGSTGEPKGTLIEHRAFSSSSLAHSEPLRVTSDCRVFQFSSYTFDASLSEILTPLMNGATVCVPTEESRLNDLVGAINSLQANHLCLTPSVIGLVEPSMVPNVKSVVLAGEAMSESQRDAWCKVDLVNGFGPTETSITSAVNSKVTQITDCKDIGLPVGGRCWIVDPEDHDRLMPVGAPGEMLVEGPSLARGYVNSPQKTVEVFIYDPAWAVDQAHGPRRRRFYKTGDLVRYNSTVGKLTYIGRKDTQVKLHGQRVEIGEIESCLSSETYVRHALVFVPRSGYAQDKLVTVVCLADSPKARTESIADGIRLDNSPEEQSRIATLRKRLRTKLPMYMVPTVWLNVESLPLLASGKLDRKKVVKWVCEMEEDPEWDIDEDASHQGFASDTERQITQIWSRILNIPEKQIKLTESFLRLGGDSLAAMTCASQCRKAGIQLTVQDILRCRSIEDLARNIPEMQIPAPEYEEDLQELFDLSPIQYLHSVVRKEDEGHFNQSVFTRLNQRIETHVLKSAIEALVSRHSMLRARFSHAGPEKERKMQQRITPDVQSSYRFRYHTLESSAGIDEILTDSQRSINCFVGPLTAVDLIEVDGQGQFMFGVAHHLVVDIVSWRLILEDMEELLLEPDKAALARSSLPFQKWCTLQAERCCLGCEEIETPPPNDLSIWGADNSTATYGDVECATFEVDAESTSLILTGCHHSANTETVDLLLASLLQAFARAFPDGPAPVIYNEGHGREAWDSSIDISRTVGWFTTLYPIWVRDIQQQHPIETVIHVKDTRRRAIDNGRTFFAYSTLTEEGQKRYPHPTPMGISFNYLGQNRDLQNESGLFRLANKMVGETREGGGSADFGHDTPRFAMVEISAAVVHGRLRFTFSFSKKMSHQCRLHEWISNCQGLLTTLPRQMLSSPATRTLSDFSMLPIGHSDFQKIQSHVLPEYGIASLDEVEDMFPCTRVQQGILLSRLRNPSLYAVHTTFEVRNHRGAEGNNIDRLVESWDKVVARHSMLRTVFVDKFAASVQFAQVVLKDRVHVRPNYLECVDEDKIQQVFDSQPPVATRLASRFSICKASNDKVFCRLEINHAAMDGDSISILLHDLRRAYTSDLDNQSVPRFKDFVNHLQHLPSDAGLDYWTSYLKNVKPCHFPVKNTAIETRGALRTMRFNLSRCDQLNQLCKAVGITPSTVFNVAWGLLLSSMVDSDDVCFTYTASLRDVPVDNIESIVGPVMNLAVCRMKLPPTAELQQVLHHAQDEHTTSLPYRSCSLIDIQHRLKLPSVSLFNSGVSYRKLPLNSQYEYPVEFAQTGLIHDPAETCVFLNVEATELAAQIELNYWTECLSDSQAETVADLLREYLDAIINDPSQEVGQLNLVTEAQRKKLPESRTAAEIRPLDWKSRMAETEPCYFPALVSSCVDSEIEVESIRILPTTDIHAFCKKMGVPVSSIYELVWGLILRLYSGSTEVCFGVLDITEDAGLESLGHLTTSVVSLDGLASVMKALQQLAANSAGSYQSRMPTSEFLRGLRHPFNSVVCTEQSVDEKDFNAVFRRLIETSVIKTAVYGSTSNLAGAVDIYFSSDHVSKPFVSSIASCFEHLFCQILKIDRTDSTIDELDFFDDFSSARVCDWNQAVPERYEKCVHELVQLQAWLGGNSTPAICSWDEDMTYSELWAVSTKLSCHLRTMGVQTETFVGLCFDKSAWAIVSQLAVFKAGGAFISLDPSHSESRLQNMIGQVEAPIVLCSPAHYNKVSRICRTAFAVDRRAVDELPNTIPSEQHTVVSPCHAAYAVATSGTTGMPKVTVIEHYSLTTAVIKWSRALSFSSNTRAFQFCNLSFDVSLSDIYFTLVNGGCLCIPSDDERMNDPAGAMRRMDANLLSAVPSFVNSLAPDSIPSVKTIIMGGEKMPPGSIEKWKDRRLFNAYGPCEATIYAAVSMKSPGNGTVLDSDHNDIGIDNSGRTWVVDPSNYQRLVPHGAIGELLVEGPLVGRGYLNNDDKTKQVFVNDPVWTQDPRLQGVLCKKERMYRTGDLVRYTARGTLLFLSRKDTQIKLNGQRIELEEIEYNCAALLPSDSLVIVEMVTPLQRTIAPGLAVFFTTSSEISESVEEHELLLPMTTSRKKMVEGICKALRDHLPFFMIPKFFFPIRYLPRSVSTKVDRRTLRETVQPFSKTKLEPYTSSSRSQTRFRRNGLEAKLRTLWEQVMDLAPGSVADDDNFFGIGGDSLAAMNLVSVAQSQGIAFGVSDVFKHPVLLELADVCKTNTQVEVAGIDPFALLPAQVPLKEIMDELTDSCSITASSIMDVYPCSPVQEGLITSSTTQEGAYVVRCVYRIAESVDLTEFKQAWQRTVDELEILRTRILHTAAANFCQVVLKPAPIPWVHTSVLPTASDKLPALPSLPGGPLAEYEIVETGYHRYFVWSIHHAIYDGWSIPLILQKTESNYLRSPTRKVASYNSFIRYLLQRNLVESDVFWTQYFSGFQSSSFPRVDATKGDIVSAGNQQQSCMKLRQVSPSCDVTLPVVIRAAWALVVARQVESGDVCFGETLMGRNINLPGVTEMAGPVLTTVPTRIQVDRQSSILSFLEKVNQQSVDTIPHQHAGIQRIRKLSQEASMACHFQNLLVVQTDSRDANGTLWEFEDLHASKGFFTYPLVIECKITEEQIRVTAHHDETIISALHVQKLIRQLNFLVEQLVEIPKHDDRKVATLDFAPPSDKQQIMSWNDGRLPAMERCIHDLIREQSVLQPESQAVCAWDGTLSYQQVWDFSSDLAQYIISLGVGPEKFVPICMDKSVWAVVAVLAVLIADGAFVPLDPAHPKSRHEEIIADVSAELLICSPKYSHKYMDHVKNVIPFDGPRNETSPERMSRHSLRKRATSSNMAFALFTSGSTGRPKGIVTEHGSFLSSVTAFGPAVCLGRGVRGLHFASLTFDAAIMEVLGVLIFGGCVCIPSEEERLNHISGAIRRMHVSWAFCTPSVASIIEPSSVPSLKTLVCGGEMLSMEVIKKWSRSATLINGYGPTETSVFATLNTNVTTSTEPSCIGRGIKSTCTWIVDPEDHNRLVPVGDVGELCLSGRPLARGYLNNPEKTATEFIDNPRWASDFPNTSAKRIYKTGDLVRYFSDGSVECLGRKDHQVKLHGQRMELGEIESRLGGIANIRHAVVLLPKTGLMKNRLVAVLSLNGVVREDNSLISDDSCQLVDEAILQNAGLSNISKTLESQLPKYMVPQAWAVMESLPMLVSGKIDRKRIMAWVEHMDKLTYERLMQDDDMFRRGGISKEVRLSNHVETSTINGLRDVCATVLNLPASKLDMNRSFISLGGDSISGMAFVSHARRKGITIKLRDVLQIPSLKGLVQSASSKKSTQKQLDEVGKLFPLSPIQELYFRSAVKQRGSSRFNQSITVHATQRIEPSGLRKALQAITSRHGMLRGRFVRLPDGSWKQKIVEDVERSYRLRIHMVEDSTSIPSVISETQCSFDIATGPVLGADLFNLADDRQVLFLVAHHLCIDMVSWRVILQDLEDFLQTGALNAEVPFSFQQWCCMRQANGSVTEASKGPDFVNEAANTDYWGLRNAHNTYGQVKTKTIQLGRALTESVFGGWHESLRVEPLDLLLAVAFHSFSQTFADRDLPIFYNESHGRQSADPAVDVSGTVGWFTALQRLQIPTLSDDITKTICRINESRRGTSVLSDVSKCPCPLEIMFNYLGRLQQLERQDSLFHHYGSVFKEGDVPASGDMGPDTVRFALFELTAIVVQDNLHVSFTFNKNMRRQGQLLGWISTFQRVLHDTMSLLSKFPSKQTIKQFPLLPANQGELQELLDEVLPRLGIHDKGAIEDIYPCSPVQEGILLSQLRDPNSYMFHAIFEVTDNRTKRPADVKQLLDAWQQVVGRHPILRTIFVESNYKDGTFDQVILREVHANYLEIDCGDEAAVTRLGEVRMQDLNTRISPLVPHQVTVCQTQTGQTWLKLEMNHALIDGGSVSVLLRDFSKAYSGQLPASPGPLYSDYVRYLKDASHEEDIAHWTRYLQGVQPCHLPCAHEGGSARQLNSITVGFHKYDALQDLCQKKSVTLANLALATWALILRAFTGRDDVCFGYLSAGRDAPISDIQDAVGVYINMLCCRVQFSSQQRLEDVLKGVQTDYLDSLPHQKCSLAQIKNKLGIGEQHLFNTTLSIQNEMPSDLPESAALSFKAEALHDPSEYPITVNVLTGRGNEGVMLRYWSDSVPDSQAQRLAICIAECFECFLQNSSQLVSTIPGLTPRECRPRKSSPAPLDMSKLFNMNALQKLIDDRVYEIVGHILGKEGLQREASSAGFLTPGESRLSVISHDEQPSVDSAEVKSFSSDSTAFSSTPEKVTFLDVDRKLLKLWATSLEVPEDSMRGRDNFFKLGGDSIRAMKMASAAREQGISLKVSDIFRYPVFNEMVNIATAKTTEADTQTSGPKSMQSPSHTGQITPTYSAVNLDPQSLQDHIYPKIGLFKGEVTDVLPVTDFQSMCLTGQQFGSRWMLNYFFFDGAGPLDVRRLQESCSRVIEAFDILRSVFVCSGNHFYQVFLKKVTVNLSVHETEKPLDEFTEDLQKRDRELPIRQGESMVKFIVAKKINSDRHRILIRLPHAQYDGVCLSKLLDAVKQGYEAGPLPLTSSFASHMRLLSSSVTPEHYRYYRSLLRGSKIPQIIRRRGANTYRYVGASASVAREVEIFMATNANITIATVVQAAWALTLAKISGQSDIVFGLTVNGRNASFPGIETAVGPCVNVLPVRVKFGKQWNGLDLFRYIQDQQVANMPYENLGFREIIHRCTDWPKWSYFSTAVFHQNVPYEGHTSLDDSRYRIGGVGVVDNLSDLTLVSTPISETQFRIALYYSEKGPIDSAFASRILNKACDSIEGLTTRPSSGLPSSTTLESLPVHIIDDFPSFSDEKMISSYLQTYSKEELLAYSSPLNCAWQQVLLPDQNPSRITADLHPHSSFFSLGGDVFNMGQVACLLQEQKFDVRIEDLLEHPTLIGHMFVLKRLSGS